MASLVSSTRNLKKNHASCTQTFPKSWRRGSTSKFILQGQLHADSKPRQGHHTKGQVQATIANEFRHKYSQHSSKQKSTARWKDRTLWSSDIYPWNARMGPYAWISKCDAPQSSNERWKSVSISIYAEKAFVKMSHPFMIRTLHRFGVEEALQHNKGHRWQAPN